MKYLVFCLSLLLVFSCKSNKTASENQPEEQERAAQAEFAPGTLVLSISTSPCFGQCPVYELNVYGNQSVEFTGKRFAHKEGTFHGTLTKEQFAELLELMDEAELEKANDVYDNPDITDLPMTTILYTTDSGKKSIKARYDVPENIKSFINKTYELSKSIRWDINTTTEEE